MTGALINRRPAGVDGVPPKMLMISASVKAVPGSALNTDVSSRCTTAYSCAGESVARLARPLARDVTYSPSPSGMDAKGVPTPCGKSHTGAYRASYSGPLVRPKASLMAFAWSKNTTPSTYVNTRQRN